MCVSFYSFRFVLSNGAHDDGEARGCNAKQSKAKQCDAKDSEAMPSKAKQHNAERNKNRRPIIFRGKSSPPSSSHSKYKCKHHPQKIMSFVPSPNLLITRRVVV